MKKKRGISGGERKRTSIGVELLTNPSLIFLDEPTTGLDSSTALNLMMLIKKLASEGRTIISTIHQPSSDIFNSFDKLILLVEGHSIYCVKKSFIQYNIKYFIKKKREIRRILYSILKNWDSNAKPMPIQQVFLLLF